MNNPKANITHLFHSGFTVETENYFLVFDYCNPSTHFKLSSDSILTRKSFKNKKNIYVFVTHSHGDHFDPVILKWHSKKTPITYIFSDDVEIENPKSNHYFMKKYESRKFESIDILTYGTTDLGVSFLVEVDGLSIYHGGDLNWWHWKNDTSENHIKEEKDYKYEVDKLKDKNIDIAFIPVDPRLEEYYHLGGEYFAQTIEPSLIIPMHFANNYGICSEFKEKIKDLDSQVALISPINKSFIYIKK